VAVVIGLAAVDDDRMLLSGLAAWLAGARDMRLIAVADTVELLLRRGTNGIDVVLLDLLLADRSDPADNVRRIAAAGPRVLVVSVVADPDQIMAAYAAGAACYLTKDHDLGEVANAVRDIASSRDRCPPELAFAMAHDSFPGRPRLSGQERRLLRAYAAGMTLEAAARRTGIRPATAKHYLERIKQKYRSAGRPTYTKLDLAARVREDGLLRYPLAGGKAPPPMAAVASDSDTR
jgi:two-component system nitrate/nitrite response regulator NarL